MITNYGYTVFPLFILMGQIGYHAGIAKRLYNSAHAFVGHIPGGLAIATVLGGSAFKAICGSATATTATFASVAMPEMDRYGYDKRLSTGTVATVGTLGCLIPPSVVLILYGIITEQSIGKLFLAGIVPAAIIALFFIGVIVGWVKINPKIAPISERSTWKDAGPYTARCRLGARDLPCDDRRHHAGFFHADGGGFHRGLCGPRPRTRQAGYEFEEVRTSH